MRKIHHIAILTLALCLLPLSASTGQPTAAEMPARSQSDWLRLAPRDEEFSVLTPVQPSLLIQADGYKFSDGGEKVLQHRSYSGYSDGFVFVIESYRAARPHRLLKDIDRIAGMGRLRLKALENVTLGGFEGKKYEIGLDNFAGYVYVFVAAKHVYTLLLASRDKNHPSFNQFIPSLTLGDTTGVVGSVPPKIEDASVSVDYSDPVISGKETTQRAIVVWKPEPTYTESARHNQRIGTVALKGIFTSSGEVIIVRVIKRLEDGLTEKAIEAAKQVRFFPAEKDGKLVSFALQFEYNFSLY